MKSNRIADAISHIDEDLVLAAAGETAQNQVVQQQELLLLDLQHLNQVYLLEHFDHQQLELYLVFQQLVHFVRLVFVS